MVERARSFGAIAAGYERFRPGYPEGLADRIMGYAGRPVRTALEIGAGTGKATRLLAARGVEVTATEPDAAMLDELRRRVPDSVRTVRAAFEELSLDRRYDLVLAAASLHWTRPEGRWERVAALLTEGGVFASCGGPVRLADPGVEAAVRAARAGFLDDDELPSPDGTAEDAALRWPGTEMLASPLLTDVEQSVLPRRSMRSPDEWVGYLSTVSAYVVLPEAARREVLARIRAVLPDRAEVVSDVVLHLARRR
ncbi:methyltransferase [uncultured Amnibacterium sp.]|uniref:methyltransferase n=1 Tax=uncultured Amnibacterium sp. TaxID=1631851 RepID=UPI0035CC81BC